MKFSTCVKFGAGFYLGYKILEGIDEALGRKFNKKIHAYFEKLKTKTEETEEAQ